MAFGGLGVLQKVRMRTPVLRRRRLFALDWPVRTEVRIGPVEHVSQPPEREHEGESRVYGVQEWLWGFAGGWYPAPVSCI